MAFAPLSNFTGFGPFVATRSTTATTQQPLTKSPPLANPTDFGKAFPSPLSIIAKGKDATTQTENPLTFSVTSLRSDHLKEKAMAMISFALFENEAFGQEIEKLVSNKSSLIGSELAIGIHAFVKLPREELNRKLNHSFLPLTECVISVHILFLQALIEETIKNVPDVFEFLRKEISLTGNSELAFAIKLVESMRGNVSLETFADVTNANSTIRDFAVAVGNFVRNEFTPIGALTAAVNSNGSVARFTWEMTAASFGISFFPQEWLRSNRCAGARFFSNRLIN